MDIKVSYLITLDKKKKNETKMTITIMCYVSPYDIIYIYSNLIAMFYYIILLLLLSIMFLLTSSDSRIAIISNVERRKKKKKNKTFRVSGDEKKEM